MGNKQSVVNVIKEGLVKPNNANTSIMKDDSLFFFFSVDICNSTALKYHNNEWFEANHLLYKESFSAMHFWKYNGDEVLYVEPFTDFETLANTIKSAWEYIRYMQTQIRETIHDNSFQLKGTMWFAHTNGGSVDSQNIHIKYSSSSHEFLGNNIDEGFRLEKKVSGSKIALDSTIVYMLLLVYDIYEDNRRLSFINENHPFYTYVRNLPRNVKDIVTEVLEHTRFISFTGLKGVWRNRAYPVFWCYWEESDFAYDEKLDEKYVIPTPIISNAPNGAAISEWSCVRMEKIFEDVNKQDEIVQILSAITDRRFQLWYTLESEARLYYAVACINPKSNNVLIAQRSEDRAHLKRVWEFIPFKHTTRAVSQCIENAFLNQFGLKISLFTDNEKEQNVLPVHFCTIFRNGQAHNSLLCIAEFKEAGSDEEIIDKMKEHVEKKYSDRKDNFPDEKKSYTDFRFVSVKDVDNYTEISLQEIEKDSLAALSKMAEPFKPNTCAMYLSKSIEAVTNIYRKLKDGKEWYKLNEK